MASVKGRIHHSWSKHPVAILGKTVLAIRYKRMCDAPDVKPSADEMTAFFWKEIGYVSNYVVRKDGEPAGKSLGRDSIYGRAFTPWKKTKRAENPYKNPNTSAYCHVAESILDAIEGGRSITQKEFEDSAQAQRLVLSSTDLRDVPSLDLLREVERRLHSDAAPKQDAKPPAKSILRVDHPTADSPMGAWASAVLGSGWDFSGVDDCPPDRVYKHLKRWEDYFVSVPRAGLSPEDDKLVEGILYGHHDAYYESIGRRPARRKAVGGRR